MKTQCLASCLAVGLLLVPTAALAQRAASTKALGTAYDMWSNGVYFDHAMDHARVLRSYAASSDEVPREVVQRHYDAMRTNLAAAKESHASLTKSLADDKTASGHLATIGQHHAKAQAAVEKLNPASAKGPYDAKVVRKHANATLRSLRQAKAEHAALMKHLKIQGLKAPGKGKAKPKAAAATTR